MSEEAENYLKSSPVMIDTAAFGRGGLGSGVGDFREAAERAARILADLESGDKAVEITIGPFDVYGITIPAIPLRFKLSK